MAQLDQVISIYHVTRPTGEHLLGLSAPRWPDTYNLTACLPDPGLAPKETLEWAFTRTQQDHPLIDTVSWQPGARRRSTSPGDVVVLSAGDAYLCDAVGWKPLPPPAPGFWTRLVSGIHRPGSHSMAR